MQKEQSQLICSRVAACWLLTPVLARWNAPGRLLGIYDYLQKSEILAATEMDTKNLRYLVKFLASADSIPQYKQAINGFFNNLQSHKFCLQIEIGEVKTSLNEFNYDELQEISVSIACTNIENNHDVILFVKDLHNKWCEEAEKNHYLAWFVPEDIIITSPAFVTGGDLRPSEIAFGTLPGMKDFVQTYCFHELKLKFSIKASILCKFLHLQKQVVIFVSNTHKQNCKLSGEMGYKMTFTYNSIIRVIGNGGSDTKPAEIFFHLEYPPFIHMIAPNQLDSDSDEEKGPMMKVVKAKELDYSPKRFERTFEMGCSCNNTLLKSTVIGRNLVLKLISQDKFQFRENLEQLRLRCNKKTEVCFTHVKTIKIKPENKVKLKFFPHYYISSKRTSLNEVEKFNCDYAWGVIHTRSDVILHHMSLKSMECKSDYKSELLQSVVCFVKSNLSAFIKALYSIADMIDKGIIFNFLPALNANFSYYCNFVELNELPRGMSYVRRVILTPSRTIYLKPYEHFDNRIIRAFGIEYMMRVSIQDDNFSKLTYAVQYNSCRERIMNEVVGDVLLNGIVIGSRKYELLAASTSQMRDHGMWMYAEDMDGYTASKIRKWMGDFSAIKNVAKYMARMGQCLSSTETGVTILVKDEDELPLEEVKTRDGRYIFSDGIGIVSSSLAEEVRQVMIQNSYASSDITVEETKMFKPVAFQIRYRGCKGMVVEYPIGGRKIKIRPSMNKFECTTSKYLEIVKTSAPTKLFLNKHLITILEQMGVPKEVFMNLEIDMIMHHFNSLMDEEEAARLLSENLSPVFPFNALQKSGIVLTSDPFFRSLLLAYFKSFAEKLKMSMRIAIPDQYGRNMLGVLDETKTLKYGQVFVQYSKSLTDPSAGFEILKGPVLVTKNPSLHPGDVRKLIAVDVPELHHITNCIVFPARGKRPHPDEMAGSDLDGDEMVVIWYKPLIFERPHAKPMDYPVYKEKSENNAIQLPDMINFFCEYIQNDNIGTFAHAHLVWADRLPNGIFSKKCMDIAKRYPYVLDFAKHGTTEHLKRSERPHHYPDFLQKGVRGNTYHSHRVLGALYRTSRVVNACSSKINLMCETSLHDPDLEYPGWEKYEISAEAHRKEYTAKVLEVLDCYCLVSEAEAFSGFIEVEAYKKWREEKSNAVKVVTKYMNSIMGYFRNVFLSEVRKEHEDEKLSEAEGLERKFQRASAWYMVVYGKKSTRVLSFPWVLGDILAKIKKKRKNNCLDPEISSFFTDIDRDIKKWCIANEISCDKENCLCSYLLAHITQAWIAKSGLNIGNSDESTYCSDCYDRIFNCYLSKSNLNCCKEACTDSSEVCTWDKNCSPAKVLVHFLKFFISNVESSLGSCDKDACEGFLPKNLQELALQTFSYLAITRNIFYLGIHFTSDNFTTNAIAQDEAGVLFEEEGDPFKIPVDRELKKIINFYMEDIKVYLKKTSGVRAITLTPDVNSMGLIINSIGKNWKRWNLQELLLDTNLKANLKQNLNIQLEALDDSDSS